MKNDGRKWGELEISVLQAVIIGYLKRDSLATAGKLKEWIEGDQGYKWSRTGFLKALKRLEERGYVDRFYGGALDLTDEGDRVLGRFLKRMRLAFKGLEESEELLEEKVMAKDPRMDQGEARIEIQDGEIGRG